MLHLKQRDKSYGSEGLQMNGLGKEPFCPQDAPQLLLCGPFRTGKDEPSKKKDLMEDGGMTSFAGFSSLISAGVGVESGVECA